MNTVFSDSPGNLQNPAQWLRYGLLLTIISVIALESSGIARAQNNGWQGQGTGSLINGGGWPSTTGSSSYDSSTGIYTIQAVGNGIDSQNWGDQIFFVNTELAKPTNFELIARISSATAIPNQTPEIGLMVRTNLTSPPAAFTTEAMAMYEPGTETGAYPNSVEWHDFNAQSGAADTGQLGTGSYVPAQFTSMTASTGATSCWLKIERTGVLKGNTASSRIAMYMSTDGKTWSPVTSAGAGGAFTYDGAVYVGLFVSSGGHNRRLSHQAENATFDNVTLTESDQ